MEKNRFILFEVFFFSDLETKQNENKTENKRSKFKINFYFLLSSVSLNLNGILRYYIKVLWGIKPSLPRSEEAFIISCFILLILTRVGNCWIEVIFHIHWFYSLFFCNLLFFHRFPDTLSCLQLSWKIYHSQQFCLSRSWYTKLCQEIQHSCCLLSTHIFHGRNQPCADLANPSCLRNREFLKVYLFFWTWSRLITLCPKHKKLSSLTFRNILQVTLILGHAVAHMKVTATDTDGDYCPPNCLPLVMLLSWKLSCLQGP